MLVVSNVTSKDGLREEERKQAFSIHAANEHVDLRRIEQI